MAPNVDADNLPVRVSGGSYEIWFAVVFEPGEKRAYWFRYTRLSPNRDSEGTGQAMVWAAVFDAEAPAPARASKMLLPLDEFSASESEFSVSVGEAAIGRGFARGAVTGAVEILWDLQFQPAQTPSTRVSKLLGVLPLPVRSHHAHTDVRFDGELVVDGERRVLVDAVGTQMHIHGTKRVRQLHWIYAPRFDNRVTAALELTSGRLGAVLPAVNALWFGDDGGDSLDSMTAIWNSPRIKITSPRSGMLRVEAKTGSQRVVVRAWADPNQFVGYHYRDPRGFDVPVAQSDIASCSVEVFKRRGVGWRPVRALVSDRGAALEIHGGDELQDVAYIGWQDAGLAAASVGLSSSSHEASDDEAGQGDSLEPVGTPGRIVAFGLTYGEHIRETGMTGEDPVLFDKAAISWAPHAASVAVPSSETLIAALEQLEPGVARVLHDRFGFLPAMMDYEVELGIKLLEPVTRAQLQAGALPRVAYFLANDLTARSLQILGEGQPDRLAYWSLAKSMPDFLPVGGLWQPPDDERDSIPSLTLRTWVNGRLRQEASTDDLVLTLPQLLATAADYAGGSLAQGDVLLTGTPSGVALTVPAWKRKLAGAILDRFGRLAAALSGYCKTDRFCGPGDVVCVDGEFLGRRKVMLALPGDPNTSSARRC